MRKYVTDSLSKDIIDAIRRMAHMAEDRDPNIMNHLDRVRSYAFLVARGIGLSLQEAEIISYASQLHDIGKVGLPEDLANKTERLTTYEWETMKQHTTDWVIHPA